MAIYRFRVVFEDHDEVQRDIEIKASQTFLDLHQAIQEAIRFDSKHAASFFVSDDYWRKNQEITLLEEDLDPDVKLMSKVKISSQIENPYQRFIYLYDKQVQWTLTVELIKIDNEDPKKNYPCCVKSLGNPPKQYKQSKPVPEQEVLSPEAAATKLLEDLHADDTDAYKHADEEKHLVDEEDVKMMEGEEGEEGDEEDMSMDENADEEGNEGEMDYGSGEEQDDKY